MKKTIQGFLFTPCEDSADERDFGDNDVSYDHNEKDDLYWYDFQLGHIDSLNWCSCGTVTECVCGKCNPFVCLTNCCKV